MDDIRITLGGGDILAAAYVGLLRQYTAAMNNRAGVGGQPYENGWSNHIEGALGEFVVAKYLGVFWKPNIGVLDDDDVGPYQVRTNSSRKGEDLAIRPKDKPHRVYISVLSLLPEFIICGWVYGHEGKRDEYIGPGSAGRPPLFWVPRKMLHPMAELPVFPPL